MKTHLKKNAFIKKALLLWWGFISLLLLCSSCRSHVGNEEKQALYLQALHGLDNRSFTIEAYEFHIFDGYEARTESSSGSYITMNGSLCKIRIEPKVFPEHPFHFLNIQDEHSEIVREASKKQQDSFIVKVDGGENWLRYHLHIDLYKGSNECFIQVKTATGQLEYSIKGRITAGAD